MVDVGVELYDGSYHEVDSSEMAFKIVALMAFREAMGKGKSTLKSLSVKSRPITPLPRSEVI